MLNHFLMNARLGTKEFIRVSKEKAIVAFRGRAAGQLFIVG